MREVRSRPYSFGALAVLFVAVAIVLFAACQDDAGVAPTAATTIAPASATPAASASPTITAAPTTPSTSPESECPVEGAACSVARSIADSIRAGDLGTIVAGARSAPVDCGDEEQSGAEVGVCEGQADAEIIEAYPFSFNGHGSLRTAEEYARELDAAVDAAEVSAADAHGEGATALVSVGCPIDRPPSPCDQFFAVVLSQLVAGYPTTSPNGLVRRQIIFFFEPSEDGQSLAYALVEAYDDPAQLAALVAGGEVRIPGPSPQYGHFYALP